MTLSQFTNRMGILFEQDALPRIAGRLFGLLLVSHEPRCLDELAEVLRVSKASVSTNARLLARRGILERVMPCSGGSPGGRSGRRWRRAQRSRRRPAEFPCFGRFRYAPA